MPVLSLCGFEIYKGYLDVTAQRALLADLREIVKVAPLFSPVIPGGKTMRVRMTSAGRYGWYSDEHGYRYRTTQPNGTAWPAIPERLLNLWKGLPTGSRQPECCLINYYPKEARMGLHQDRDEADFSCPVVSVSLGDEGLLRVGGVTRGGKTESLWLQSGDVVVMGGNARLAYHGIDRIRFGSSRLLAKGGRVNVTLRVVSAA